jgi:hypothetical protein
MPSEAIVVFRARRGRTGVGSVAGGVRGRRTSTSGGDEQVRAPFGVRVFTRWAGAQGAHSLGRSGGADVVVAGAAVGLGAHDGSCPWSVDYLSSADVEPDVGDGAGGVAVEDLGELP